MLLTIVAVCGIISGYYLNSESTVSLPVTGLGLSPAHTWISPGLPSLCLNIVLSLGVALLIYLLNREFKLMRNNSGIVAGLFMVMQMSCPQPMTVFSGGTAMTLILLACVFIMFGIYSSRDCSLAVFTVFMMLGLGSLSFYGYLFLVPLALIGCLQLRILSGRTFVAALLGLITPVWILAGFGIVDLTSVVIPDIKTIFSIPELTENTIKFVCTVGFTTLLCLICGAGCVMRTYSYNSRSRSYNGFIYVITSGIILLSCVDFGAIYLYLPLLNCCAAYHTAHLFITNRNQRSYVGVILILLIYVAFYVWNFLR